MRRGSVGLWGFKVRFCATWPLWDGTAAEWVAGSVMWLACVPWAPCGVLEDLVLRPSRGLRVPRQRWLLPAGYRRRTGRAMGGGDNRYS